MSELKIPGGLDLSEWCDYWKAGSVAPQGDGMTYDQAREDLAFAAAKIAALDAENDFLCSKLAATEKDRDSLESLLDRLEEAAQKANPFLPGFRHVAFEAISDLPGDFERLKSQLTELRAACEAPLCGESVQVFIDCWRQGTQTDNWYAWDAEGMRKELSEVAAWLERLTAALTSTGER
jgi:hypothetical protein